MALQQRAEIASAKQELTALQKRLRIVVTDHPAQRAEAQGVLMKGSTSARSAPPTARSAGELQPNRGVAVILSSAPSASAPQSWPNSSITSKPKWHAKMHDGGDAARGRIRPIIEKQNVGGDSRLLRGILRHGVVSFPARQRWNQSGWATRRLRQPISNHSRDGTPQENHTLRRSINFCNSALQRRSQKGVQAAECQSSREKIRNATQYS